MRKRIIIILVVALFNLIILSGCNNEEVKKEKTTVKKNGMLSYTVDGEKIEKIPTKEEGYIVNKIICDNGTDMMWDNDNWEVELTKVNSNDRCIVDFTKDTNTSGYRVTVTSNRPTSLDSLSKATTENGTIKIYSKDPIESISGCIGEIKENKVIINNITQNQTCNITVEQKTLANIVKEAYPPQLGRTNFSSVDSGKPGLYTGTDDQGTTYYFSGDGSSMNNWVNFAGKLWRIIRINGNGSVRLLYAGDGTNAYDLSIDSFNSGATHPQAVGWKYTSGDSLSTNRKNSKRSNAYLSVEGFYNLQILNSGLAEYIDTETIYCNDRNIGSGAYSITNDFSYAVDSRITTNNPTPTFNCGHASDKFTTFGLMTADEVVYAGGKWSTNNTKAYYYLAKDGINSITGNAGWWTMSPYNFSMIGSTGYASMFIVSGSGSYPGNLGSYNVRNSHVIRPVISLKSSVIVTRGNGSGNDPYTVTLP